MRPCRCSLGGHSGRVITLPSHRLLSSTPPYINRKNKENTAPICVRSSRRPALTRTKSISSLFSMKLQTLGLISSHIPPRSLSTPSSWKVLLTCSAHTHTYSAWLSGVLCMIAVLVF